MTLGYSPARVCTERPPLSVAETMSRSAFYGEHPPVSVCETHTAWVFLAGERAYKVKKPVRMEFLDFSTRDRRREACAEEVRVNRELASGLEMCLRAIVPLSDSYVLEEPGAEGAVEYAIEMHRFDESCTVDAVAGRGELTDRHAHAVAQRLAAFHAAAHVVTPSDPVDDVKRRCDANLRELLAVAGDALARRVLMAERFADAFIVSHRDELMARARAGFVRDGHGDLRAEHVVLSEPLMIVDRLEFDVHLREIDVADDLAFLLMDLERLGASAAARLLVDAYRAAGGDPGSDALLAFYCAQHALVRAKVALLRAAQLDDPRQVAAADGGARALLDLAERFSWRARGPIVLAVSGPPASGKSTLARILARRSGWPRLSSDALRKRHRRLSLNAAAPRPDYTPEARAAIYLRLGERARAEARNGHGVIVDATFGDPRLRRAFLEGLGDVALRALDCRAPVGLRMRWAQQRDPQDADGSDATPAVAARLSARHTDWEELAEEAILTLRSGVQSDLLVDQIADWLDTPRSPGSPLGWVTRSSRAGACRTPGLG